MVASLLQLPHVCAKPVNSTFFFFLLNIFFLLDIFLLLNRQAIIKHNFSAGTRGNELLPGCS